VKSGSAIGIILRLVPPETREQHGAFSLRLPPDGLVSHVSV
jgi:hypothetical protein